MAPEASLDVSRRQFLAVGGLTVTAACLPRYLVAQGCLGGGLMLGVDQPVPAQRGNPEVQFDGQTIDQMVAAFMKQHRIPGMTLAIVQAPYIPRVVGYGVSDLDKGLLASPKTL